MNKRAVCFAISQVLEPIDTLGPAPEPSLIDGFVESPLGWWRSLSTYSDDDVPVWYPLDYFKSDMANKKLLLAMPAPALRYEGDGGQFLEPMWWCVADWGLTADTAHKCSVEINTAIVLAAAEWKNIKVGRLEE